MACASMFLSPRLIDHGLVMTAPNKRVFLVLYSPLPSSNSLSFSILYSPLSSSFTTLDNHQTFHRHQVTFPRSLPPFLPPSLPPSLPLLLHTLHHRLQQGLRHFLPRSLQPGQRFLFGRLVLPLFPPSLPPFLPPALPQIEPHLR